LVSVSLNAKPRLHVHFTHPESDSNQYAADYYEFVSRICLSSITFFQKNTQQASIPIRLAILIMIETMSLEQLHSRIMMSLQGMWDVPSHRSDLPQHNRLLNFYFTRVFSKYIHFLEYPACKTFLTKIFSVVTVQGRFSEPDRQLIVEELATKIKSIAESLCNALQEPFPDIIPETTHLLIRDQIASFSHVMKAIVILVKDESFRTRLNQLTNESIQQVWKVISDNFDEDQRNMFGLPSLFTIVTEAFNNNNQVST